MRPAQTQVGWCVANKSCKSPMSVVAFRISKKRPLERLCITMADEDVPFGLNAPHEGTEDDHTVISSASGPDGMNPLGITTMPPPAPPPGSTPNPPFNASRYQPSSSKPSSPVMEDRPPSETLPTNGNHESYEIPSDNIVGQITNGTNSEEFNEDSSDGGKRSKKPSGLGMKLVLGIAFLVVAAGGAAVGIVLGQKDDGDNGRNPIGTGGNPAPSPASFGTPSSPTLAPFSAPPAIPAQTTLGDILNRGFLRCGVSPDTKGFSVFDEKTGRHEGFDADLVSDSIAVPIEMPLPVGPKMIGNVSENLTKIKFFAILKFCFRSAVLSPLRFLVMQVAWSLSTSPFLTDS